MSSPDDRIILTKSNLQAFINGVKQKVATSVVDTLFPVGFVYVTSTAPENGGDPNDLFPGTHWTRLEGAYICAARDNDPVDDNKRGQNSISSGQIPNHYHPINNASGQTGSGGSMTGTAGKILYKGDQSLSCTGIFSATNQSGSWYGWSYIPNNTQFVKLSAAIPGHSHSIPDNTESDNSNVTTMSLQPKTLYKYFWERDT